MAETLDKYAKSIESTVGDLTGLRQDPIFTVTDAGEEIDLTTLSLNSSSPQSKHITLENTGSQDVRVAYNKNGSDITYSDLPFLPTTSWNHQLNKSTETGSVFSIDGNATKIAFRCDSSLTSTVRVTIL